MSHETDSLHWQVDGCWILKRQIATSILKIFKRINYAPQKIKFKFYLYLTPPNIAPHICTALVTIMLIHENHWNYILKKQRVAFPNECWAVPQY